MSNYICEDCGKSFRTKAGLSHHKRSVRLVKEGRCNFSSKNRPKSSDGKDLYTKIRLDRGNHNFLKKNLKYDNSGKCISRVIGSINTRKSEFVFRKYGTYNLGVDEWHRTEWNNDPNNNYYLSDERIIKHNENIKRCTIHPINIIINNKKLLLRSSWELMVLYWLLVSMKFKTSDIIYEKQIGNNKPDFYIVPLNKFIEVHPDFDLNYKSNKYKNIPNKIMWINKSKLNKILNRYLPHDKFINDILCKYINIFDKSFCYNFDTMTEVTTQS